VNRHHNQVKSYKGQYLIGAGLQVQRSSRWEHGSTKAAMVQAEHLHLHLEAMTDFQVARVRVLMPSPTVTHLLQQGPIYSNKAKTPNSATPWAKHIQTITTRIKTGSFLVGSLSLSILGLSQVLHTDQSNLGFSVLT